MRESGADCLLGVYRHGNDLLALRVRKLTVVALPLLCSTEPAAFSRRINSPHVTAPF